MAAGVGAAGRAVTTAGGGAVLLPLLPSADMDVVKRPSMPIAAEAAAEACAAALPAMVLLCDAGGKSPGARPRAFRRLSSFCFASSASWLATASAVLALHKLQHEGLVLAGRCRERSRCHRLPVAPHHQG